MWPTERLKFTTGGVNRDVAGDLFGEIHVNYEGNNRSIEVEHFDNSDNAIQFLLVDDRIVAFVIERRTAFNNIEMILSHKPFENEK